jgi:hypothetical protein
MAGNSTNRRRPPGGGRPGSSPQCDEQGPCYGAHSAVSTTGRLDARGRIDDAKLALAGMGEVVGKRLDAEPKP